MKYNYQRICNSLLKDMPGRTGAILSRRFGLDGERETLESIGKSYGITRERVRQIEKVGLSYLKKKLKNAFYQKVFYFFIDELKSSGSLRKEDLLLKQLAGTKFRNHVFFLLTLGEEFERFSETEDFYPFWTIDRNSLNTAKKVINSFILELQKRNQPLALPANVLPSYIEISKHILKGPEGLYGLRDWPEINPRNIKDKAYIVLKKAENPLHFSQVARFIGRDVSSQTVHNELIKDPRFVLVGRGLYALGEWGYEPGVVREVISKTLVKAKKPLSKEEIIEKVLEQRYVKPNTILLNLANKKYFIKNPQGKYIIRKA